MEMSYSTLPRRSDGLGVVRAVTVAALICVAIIAGSATLNAEPAFANPVWTQHSSPNPAASEENNLLGVSCTASTSCVSVGWSYNKTGGKVALAEHWNGTAWSLTYPTSPASTVDELLGVSCASATACTAVGGGESEGTRQALAESWNGTTWSTQTLGGLPSGAVKPKLSGVSCTAANACTAVGSYENSSNEVVTLAERWNGSTWTVQTTVNVTKTATSLLGVSCVSASFCVAVGNKAGAPLVEEWNGSKWSLMTAAEGATGLTAVSCTSSSFCLALGANSASAETWNGSAWSPQSVVTPMGGELVALLGVSCVSSTSCAGVGSYLGESGYQPLVEHWNGAELAVQAVPAVTGAGKAPFQAVSCASSASCAAVGFSSAAVLTSKSEHTLAASWNGTEWTLQTSPNPAASEENSLLGVSCVTVSTCVGVGWSGTKSGARTTLAELWTGTEWVLQRPANPAAKDKLSAISCVWTGCTAVGQGESGVTEIIEFWNGTEWSTQTAAALPTGGASGELSGVSCYAEVCTAIGHYTNSASEVVTLAERWNGSAWSVQSTPSVSGGPSELQAVSCPSSSFCIAVGRDEGKGRFTAPLVEKWNGTEWSLLTVPAPEHGAGLNGVSCVSVSSCVAVGESAEAPFAETWNGSAWVIQSVPSPAGSRALTLLSVSCVSWLTNYCSTVGDYRNAKTEEHQPLAEEWNGEKFALQSLPAITESELNGVSCTSSEFCAATGYVSAKVLRPPESTLTELYQ
jgi:hypothetical protein